MTMLKKLFSRQFYRSIPFWFLFLTCLYSLCGFLLLPKLLNDVITDQVKTHLGWQTSIEKIEFNPFLMTLSIHQLAIYEDQKVALSFSRFHADFELRSLTEGAYTFKNVELVDPNFSLSIDENGSTNIQNALNAHQQPIVKIEQEPEDKAEQVLPKLLFDNISVINGSLNATDQSHGQLITHNINPITFKLQAFSTYIEKGGDYHLQLSLEKNQSLEWSGNIAVSPVSSSGSLTIKGIRLHRFWPYIKAYSPYELRNSNLDITAEYALNFVDEKFQLTLNDAYITFNDIQLADPQNKDKFLDINQIKIGPTAFDLLQQSVEIEKIDIDSIELALIRDKNGELELLQALNRFNAEKAPQPEKAQPTSPFQWAIDAINIHSSRVQLTDHSPEGSAAIKVHNIDATLSALNHTLANQQPFSLSYQVESSQKNNISGNLVLTPFSLNSDIKLANIPLNIIQPYLSEIANVKIKEGNISLDGKAQFALSSTQELAGKFTGQIDIAKFDSQDTLINRRLLGWEQLTVAPMTVNFSPLSIDIKKVLLNKPYSRLIITEDKQVNFSQLMVQQTAATAEPTSTPPKTATPNVEITEISFKNGEAYFADLSLIPQFGTSIQNLNGYIKGLSSMSSAPADVDISGSVEEYGKVAVKGQINPLADQLYADMNVNFDKVELTTLTPYSGRYAGYVIDKGKLSLDLNYKIIEGILDGKNRLILDQFELGDKVESEEAVDLPIKLALALFKDSNGVIDINLPTKGDMNSPDFEIGGLVMKALLNIMTKAIASPFSLLANLADGDEQSLNSVSFELGSAVLNKQQKSNLKTLASLLTSRPQLILEIRVYVDSKQEKHQLQRQALIQQLNLDNKENQQGIKEMEALFNKLKGRQAASELKAQLSIAQDDQQKVDEKQIQQHYEQALFDQLVLLQPIETLQLRELAQQRISAIKNELITINKVNNQQVFALNPSLNGSAEGSIISTIFSLNSK